MIAFDTTACAYIIGVIGSIGLIMNLTVAYAIRKSPSFGYAFGTLCFSQTIADIGMVATFVFLTTGITLYNPELHSTYLGRRSGQLLIFFWEGSIFTHFFAAINRSTAINFPLKYQNIFGNPKVTKYMVLFIWIAATVQATPYFIPSCSMLFDPVSFTYAYGEGLCGEITEHYADKFTSITVVCLIGTLDMSSFFKLIQLRATSSNANARNNQNHRKREVRFFFQACAQSSLLMSTLVFFFYLVDLNLEDPWYVFVTTIVIWMLVHVLDGFVVIVFNREVRRIIFRELLGSRVALSNYSEHNQRPSQVGHTQTNNDQRSSQA